jgi:hypothetical protein
MRYLNLQDRQKKHLFNGRPKMVADGLDGLLSGPFHDSLIEVSMATIRIFAVLTRYSIYLPIYLLSIYLCIYLYIAYRKVCWDILILTYSTVHGNCTYSNHQKNRNIKCHSDT